MTNVLSLHSNAEMAAEAAMAIEQEILGAVLYRPDAMTAYRAAVQPEHFGEPLHQLMWRAMCEIHDDRGAVGPALLASRIPAAATDGLNTTVQGYVGHLVSSTTSAGYQNPQGMAAELLDHYARRQAQTIGGELIETARGLGDPSEAARAAIADLDAILAAKQKTKRTDTDLSGALTAALVAAQERRDSGGRAEVSTGLHSLDLKLGGLWRGQLIILAGRPGMGKSSMLNALMLNLALANRGVVLFSKEMDAEEVGQRAAATLVSSRHSADGLAYDDLRRGIYTERHQEGIEHAIGDLREAPVRIDAASGLTVAEITARARRYREEIERTGRRLDVVMIDYLQIIRPSGRYAGQRVNEIAEMTGALKQFAKQMGCTVLLASQLSREVEKRDDKRPMMSDLRDSGAIEQDADVICFLYREAYYLGRKEDRTLEEEDRLEELRRVTEFIISKQRHGSTGTVRLFTDMATGVVRDLEERFR